MRSAPNSIRASAPAVAPNDAPVALLLFVSGAIALVYEIAWQREFALVFGSAAPATAVVLAAYFGGLGTGALVVGRFGSRWSRPLRAYALLEAFVGLGALLVSPLLGLFEMIYPWLVSTFSTSPGGFMATRTAAAFLTLVLPTFCMGGTLPVLGELVDRRRNRLGITVGWLYVVNTMGAGLGALSVPFFLLPQLGLAKTVWLCAAINGLLAAVAWFLDRRSRSVPNEPVIGMEKREVRSPATTTTTATADQPVLTLALISGVATFALQVLWNRAFAQVHENSMYSFSVIVAVVIFALAIGGQLARLALRRGVEPRRLIGGAWLVAGLAVVIGPWMFIQLSNGLGYLPTGGGWAGDSFHLVRLAVALILAPMALLGIGLPALMEQAGRGSSETTGRVLGRLLAINVVGSVAGALLAGFILPGWLGLWGGILWLGGLLVAAGLWQWVSGISVVAHRKFGCVLAVGWLASSLVVVRVDLPRVRLASDQSEKLVALAEGTHGITAVVERGGARRIKLNNFYGLGGTTATADERMQAHLPLLLHPAPHDVAFLGLGTGITAGGALFHPVEKVTVMELVPEVVAAARTHFGEANKRVLDDTRTRVVEDDARHFLRGASEHFDVIVGDLVVPWRQGEGSLFTLEQFEAARKSLKPDGLFCQWLPLFQLSEEELNILIRTFLTVFPRAEVWRGDFWPDEPAIALIGRAADFKIDVDVVQRRLGEMRPDSTNPQLRAASVFWMHFVGVLEAADLPPGDSRLNREDRPWIELLGPMLHAGGNKDKLFTGRRLQAWLNQLRSRSRERLGPLPAREETGVSAGEILAEMVLCVAEDNHAGADAAQERLRQTLPEASYRAVMFR